MRGGKPSARTGKLLLLAALILLGWAWGSLQPLAGEAPVAKETPSAVPGQAALATPPAPAAKIAAAKSAETPHFSDDDLEFFEKEVRPVLVARCFQCHSDQIAAPKGGLRLDSRAFVLAGGDTGPAAVAGKSAESLLIDAVQYGELYQMPPKSRLPDSEVAILTRWVERGLPWPAEKAAGQRNAPAPFDLAKRKQTHWAWQPIQKTVPPPVKNQAWPAGNIDRFILAGLEQAGLQPAPPAQRSQLLRRAYFDLIGLPPTPAQVQAFLADQSPEAFARVVDELLASPHFGERWARHWLDLVRYAESRGHEFDYSVPDAWQYRDYVIRALNADVPYDQFVREHLAGDLLAKPRLNPERGFNESLLGTGFWFLGEWVHSPVDIRKDETDRLDNMVDTATKTFLGLTVGCARCHDHKFDAISQADYYALAGFLRSSSYRLANFETLEHNRGIAQQLAALDAEYEPRAARLVADSAQPVVAQLDKYLLAARSVMLASAELEDAAAKLLGTPAELNQAAAERAAAADKLDPKILLAWVEVLSVAVKEPEHPLHAWAIVAAKSPADSAASLATLLAPLRTKLSTSAAQNAAALTGARVIVDYNAPRASDFWSDGVAFGARPTQTGELLLGATRERPLEGIVRRGAARRPALWAGLRPAKGAEQDVGRLEGWVRAGQTIKSPTFRLLSGHLFYLVEGTGHVYAAVDSHLTNNGPLHGQLIHKFETKPGSGPQWVEHNLTSYAEHSVCLEFSAEGAGDFSLYMVVEADRAPGVPGTSSGYLASYLQPEFKSPAELAAAYQKLLAETMSALRENRLAKHPHAAEIADLADWLIHQPRLFTGAMWTGAPGVKELVADYQTRRNSLTSQIKLESQLAMAMEDGNGVDESLLIRGNSRTPGEPVPRRFLLALGGQAPAPGERGSGRLTLADAVLATDNPLTARVMVNRLWHHLFGRGIVASVDNFGVLGEPPTHPELLDYLATRFVAEGWSLKRMIRELVLSQTYQMSSQRSELAEQRDPMNRLLHRAQVRRLEGEIVRDALLAVSGRLDQQLFGPSVPTFLTEFMQGRGRPGSGPLDGNGRRSLYLSIRRNFLSPMLLTFDMPIPFNTVGRRNVSNVPAQALILMNDPLVVQQAELWAKRLLAGGDASSEARIRSLYLEAFAREPAAAELSAAAAFLSQQAVQLNIAPEKISSSLPLWKDLCHVLLNTKEFIYLQ